MAGLRPPKIMETTNTRERILVMGGSNMGKSYSYYCIARLALTSGSDAKFFIVDTDESVGKMLVDPVFESLWTPAKDALLNIEFTQVSEWDGFMAAINGYQARMRPQDWLMIDMLSPTWQWVQDWFTNRVYRQGVDEFFLRHRENMKATDKKGQALDGWKDWPIINQQYGKLQDRILRSPGNLYCAAEVKAINTDTVDKETRLMFGPHGVQPVGQKRNPHLFSTILWMTSSIPGVREVITIKDRSREEMHGLVIEDFAKDYLVGVAGWQAGKTPEEALAEIKAKAALKAAQAKASAA